MDLIEYLIYIHAFLGFVALVIGLVPILSKKGSKVHKLTGKIFYYSLITSCILSLFIAISPGHKSPFLFSIGVFTIYLLIGGKRSIKYKNKDVQLLFDKVCSLAMIVTGVLMMIVPVLSTGKINFVLTIFGMIGISMAILDLYLFNRLKLLKRKWLTLHIAKIMASYIASVSAFLVVNNFFPYYFNWLGPSLVGSFFIAFWIRKVQKKSSKKKLITN